MNRNDYDKKPEETPLTWTSEELQEFEKQIEPYLEFVSDKYESVTDKVLTKKGLYTFLVENGAIRVNSDNTITILMNESGKRSRYEYLMEKLSAHFKRKANVEFAMKEDLKRLDLTFQRSIGI